MALNCLPQNECPLTPKCLLACLPASLLACLLLCVLACVLACMLALHVCLCVHRPWKLLGSSPEAFLNFFFNVLLRNIMDTRTHWRMHFILTPWAPVEAKNSMKVWNVQIVVEIGQECCLCCNEGCLEIASSQGGNNLAVTMTTRLCQITQRTGLKRSQVYEYE